MGADGHIAIYDYSKLEETYDKETLDSFFSHMFSSTMYIQELSGKKYITRYWGDNIDYSDMYDIVHICYDIETDKMDQESWAYDTSSGNYFMGSCTVETRRAFKSIITFMENEARITNWEVWT